MRADSADPDRIAQLFSKIAHRKQIHSADLLFICHNIVVNGMLIRPMAAWRGSRLAVGVSIICRRIAYVLLVRGGVMFRRYVRILLGMLVVAITNAPAAMAQENSTQLREVQIVTRVLPPMVIEREQALTGFSMDLMNEIANRMKLKVSYTIAPDVRALLEEVRSQRVALGIAAVSITAAREAEFEFSQPILTAGLQIMTRGQASAGTNPLGDMLRLLISWTSLAWLGIGGLLILIPAHIVWFLERRHPEGIVPNSNYIPGIFYALYWAAGTLVTQAESAPKHAFARVVAVLWMFTGVVFVALYTAQLTATLTVQQIAGGINGPEDLAGKRVAVTAGSTAAAAVRDLQAQAVEVRQISEAYDALLSRTVDAIVFDAPVLMYYAANEGKGRVQLVGAPFRKEDYGILFPRGSALRSDVNVALLRMREDGAYQRIHDRWFASR
jgi:polar amino acid transport system substrate-binding protein